MPSGLNGTRQSRPSTLIFVHYMGCTYFPVPQANERILYFALDVRQHQLNADGTGLRISRQNLFGARKLIGRTVLLYGPRDEKMAGYFGWATIHEVLPDLGNIAFIWVNFGRTEFFLQPVTLGNIYDAGELNDAPFHTYSRAIRAISPRELTRLIELEDSFQQEPKGFREPGIDEVDQATDARRRRSEIRRRSIVRFQMLEHYGPRCCFTGELDVSLDGLRYAVEVGHIWALKLDGPDIVQNVLPMSRRVNWLWDEGILSMLNDGTPLVSSRASGRDKETLSRYERIAFPLSPLYWPRPEYIEAHRDLVFEKGIYACAGKRPNFPDDPRSGKY